MTPYTRALFEAAAPLVEDSRYAEAIAVLNLAIAADAAEPFLHYALGNCQLKAGQPEDAQQSLTLATRLDPLRAEPFNDLAAALFVLKRDAEALACLQRCLTLEPGLPEAVETDAIWLLRYGRLREGWRRYEARFRTRANRHLRRPFTQPVWQGEPLHGRTILLHVEQGLGDAMQFVRYAPPVAARGGRVVLQAYAQVTPLMRTLPGVAQVITEDEAPPPFDVHCPLMSLPLVFDTDLDSIPATVPYLTVPADRQAAWRRRLGPAGGFRVGVAWSGNPRHRDDAWRSVPLAVFKTLLAERPDVEFHVCQSPVRPDDAAVLAAMPHVRNHAGLLQDFGDTGALLSLMDLVITVDTSVAHAAGALGRPVWLLLAQLADWRWLLERADSPWYPTMRLFRQAEMGDWAGVLADVATRLRDLTGVNYGM